MPALSGSALSQPICWRTLSPPRKEPCEQRLVSNHMTSCSVCQACRLYMKDWEPWTTVFTQAWSFLTADFTGSSPENGEQQCNLLRARNLPLVACRTEHFKHSFYTMGSEGVWLIDWLSKCNISLLHDVALRAAWHILHHLIAPFSSILCII